MSLTRLAHAMGFLALAACTSPTPSSPSPARANGPRPSGTAPLPRDLPGFVVQDTMVFEEPNSGFRYAYHRDDGFQADVYFYPLPPQGYLCGGECAEEAAGALVDDFKRTIPVLIERGYVDTMIPVQEVAMAVPKDSWLHPGRHVTLWTA